MREIIAVILLIVGAIFILISSIGIVKLPDFYTRLSIISKANPIGLGLMLVALCLVFHDHLSVITQSFVAFVFLVITIPVSGHFMARVGYFIGLEKTKNMKKDDLTEKFGSKKLTENKKSKGNEQIKIVDES